MENNNYIEHLNTLLVSAFVRVGYVITQKVSLSSEPESIKYHALQFTLNDNKIVYRKGKVTLDRPGAFLSLWQRPQSESSNKPIPLTQAELDYLFVQVEHEAEGVDSTSKSGLFIFPVSVLIQKGIVSSVNHKGKTGFRVFPPWSQDRGTEGTKVFSVSGKKSQRWQSAFYVEIDKNGLIDSSKLNVLLGFNKMQYSKGNDIKV